MSLHILHVHLLYHLVKMLDMKQGGIRANGNTAVTIARCQIGTSSNDSGQCSGVNGLYFLSCCFFGLYQLTRTYVDGGAFRNNSGVLFLDGISAVCGETLFQNSYVKATVQMTRLKRQKPQLLVRLLEKHGTTLQKAQKKSEMNLKEEISPRNG